MTTHTSDRIQFVFFWFMALWMCIGLEYAFVEWMVKL